ncbi:hypothetical protein N9V24_03705 [Pseudomonadota bacterium]|nr:hypothetical protein [Pseudomonadota bacterium]
MFSKYKSILQSISLLVIFVAIAKIIGLAKEILFARNYGVSEDIDFYFFYLSLFGWPAAIILSIFSSVFIPILTSLEAQKKQVFSSELFGVSIVISAFLFLILIIFKDFLISLFPYFEQVNNIDFNYLIVSSMAPIFILISLFSVLIMASGSKVNTLMDSLPAIILMLFLTFFISSNLDKLMIATLFGFLLQLLCMIMFWYRTTQKIEIRFSFASPAWVESKKNFSIMLFSSLLLATVTLLDQFFSVNLSAESVSLLNYANKLLIVILAFGGLIIQRTFLPDFSLMNSEGNLFSRDAFFWFVLIFFSSLILSLFFFIFSEQILKLLFLRGNFSESDLNEVIPIFNFGLIQVPFYLSSLVLIQFFLSKKLVLIVAASGILAFLVKIPLNFIMLDSFGLKGLNLASSLMYIISFSLILAYFIFWYRQLNVKSSK